MGAVVRIDALLRKLGYSDAKAAHELNIPESLIRDLRAGEWLSIKRLHLNVLMRLARGLEVGPLIDWQSHALWATLGNAPLCIFHDRDADDDALFAAELRASATHLGASDPRILDQDTRPDVIDDLLSGCNCIFVGSSRRSWKSDYGYQKMCGVKEGPVDEIRRGLPVLFATLRNDWPEPRRSCPSTVLVDDPGECGFVLTGAKPRTLKVTYHETRERFERGEGMGRDGGMILARRFTSPKVRGKATWILLAGYSALATQQLGWALMNDIVPIKESDLAGANRVVRFLRFAFTKRADESVRKVVEAHREWFTGNGVLAGWNSDGLPLTLPEKRAI